MEVMQDFPLEGLHFYCDTFDITRPYPSPYPVDQYALSLSSSSIHTTFALLFRPMHAHASVS
jgi:hypothetical protein